MIVVLELGYRKYAFPQEVISLLHGVREVESKSVKGKTKYFIKDTDNEEIKISLVLESSFVYPNSKEEEESYKQICEEKEKANNDLYNRIWKEESKVKDLEAKLKAMQELCPDSHKKEVEDAT